MPVSEVYNIFQCVSEGRYCPVKHSNLHITIHHSVFGQLKNSSARLVDDKKGTIKSTITRYLQQTGNLMKKCYCSILRSDCYSPIAQVNCDSIGDSLQSQNVLSNVEASPYLLYVFLVL